jgi:hypothetical protein
LQQLLRRLLRQRWLLLLLLWQRRLLLLLLWQRRLLLLLLLWQRRLLLLLWQRCRLLPAADLPEDAICPGGDPLLTVCAAAWQELEGGREADLALLEALQVVQNSTRHSRVVSYS